MELKKNVKEDRNFKIVLEWKDVQEEKTENVKINLKINAEQKRGEKNEIK